jgi:hypothetical protein
VVRPYWQGRLKVVSLSQSKVDGAEGMAYFVKLVRLGSASRFRSNSRGSAAIDRYDWERTETRCRSGLGGEGGGEIEVGYCLLVKQVKK